MSLSVYVYMCICLSVTLRYCFKTAKDRMTQIMPHDSPVTRFLTPKITAKFERGHPLCGWQMQVACVKIGRFRQITCYNLKTVQDHFVISCCGCDVTLRRCLILLHTAIIMYCNYLLYHEITAWKPRTIQPFLVAVLYFAVLTVNRVDVRRPLQHGPTPTFMAHKLPTPHILRRISPVVTPAPSIPADPHFTSCRVQ